MNLYDLSRIKTENRHKSRNFYIKTLKKIRQYTCKTIQHTGYSLFFLTFAY